MYGCESWTTKKAGSWTIDAFELWCWRRLLRVPSTARRSNQSILKEISPEDSLEGLMLRLKLPILWPPDMKKWLIWKDPDAGRLRARGEGDDRGWEGCMASLTQWMWVCVNWELVMHREARCAAVAKSDKTEPLNWTDALQCSCLENSMDRGPWWGRQKWDMTNRLSLTLWPYLTLIISFKSPVSKDSPLLG